jgi:hypothetical protein
MTEEASMTRTAHDLAALIALTLFVATLVVWLDAFGRFA